MPKAKLTKPKGVHPLGTPFRRAVAASLCLAALSGCSGAALVAMGVPRNNVWSVLAEARAPEGPVEEAVVQAALTRQNVAVEDSDCFFIYADRSGQFVDVVEHPVDNSRMALKSVTRYRVGDGKIAAHTEPVVEIFPDVEFERAVLRCAAMARGANSVLLYDDDIQPVSMASRPLGICAAEVRIYEGNKEGRKPMAKRIVNFCFNKR